MLETDTILNNIWFAEADPELFFAYLLQFLFRCRRQTILFVLSANKLGLGYHREKKGAKWQI